jgi:hypothetical protein
MSPHATRLENWNNIFLVGPVGERPLHVCSLSASRLDQIKNGILTGMKDFLLNGEKEWNEVYVQFGKDYCAQMGWLIWNESNDKTSEPKPLSNLDCTLEQFGVFPFYSDLSRWTLKHLKNHSSSTNLDNQKIYKLLATVGLYEGENLLFPMIASSDIETVKWLLNQETSPARPVGNTGGKR